MLGFRHSWSFLAAFSPDRAVTLAVAIVDRDFLERLHVQLRIPAHQHLHFLWTKHLQHKQRQHLQHHSIQDQHFRSVFIAERDPQSLVYIWSFGSDPVASRSSNQEDNLGTLREPIVTNSCVAQCAIEFDSRPAQLHRLFFTDLYLRNH